MTAWLTSAACTIQRDSGNFDQAVEFLWSQLEALRLHTPVDEH
jgi:hypothetical protein